MKNEGKGRKLEEKGGENGIFRIKESIGRLEAEIYRNSMVRIEKSPEWARMGNVVTLGIGERDHHFACNYRLLKFLECAN